MVRRWLFVALLLCACPATGPSSSHSDPGSMCLAPPWVPDKAVAGTPRRECSDDRRVDFVLKGNRRASDAELSDFLDASRTAIHATEGVVSSGAGFCCDRTKNVPEDLCIVIGLRLCSTRVSELAETLRSRHAADPRAANLSVGISIRLEGLTSPRCEPDECGPVPYDDANERPAPTVRTRVPDFNSGAMACAHDGHCVVNGCGNECDHWTLGNAAGTCQGEGRLEEAYCGCVEERCAWFK
jgi:hypothetical protein